MSAFHHPVSVVKIGGSVLTNRAAYRRVAAFIAARIFDSPGERLLVVVSAEHGLTDALLSEARDIAGDPDSATLDLLWSTGETRSAALLTLHLHAAGVSASALNAHQTGLVAPDAAGGATMRALRLRAALAGHDVVVAPGFLARGIADRVVSLGRGGSDLTAVLIAAGLGAVRCELVKDVPGYFSADPHAHAGATHLPSIDYTCALAMADRGCDLVQRAALELARDRGVPLVVRAIDGGATLVG
jgi:aspartate kinase